MAKSKCVPLKITAHLVDGRFSSDNGILMLDAILYHAWFMKYAPQVLDGDHDDEYMRTKVKYVGLPLRQLPDNRWAASKAVYEQIGTEIDNYNKRPDFFAGDKIDYLSDKKGVIDDRAGVYRAYRNPQLIRIVKDGILTFYAVGHKKEVQELLNLMIGIGKKVAMGYGIVDRWDVEEIDEDYTTEHPVYGLMRPIEVEKSDKKYNCPIMQYCIKPPYWKAKNMRMCYVPIT